MYTTLSFRDYELLHMFSTFMELVLRIMTVTKCWIILALIMNLEHKIYDLKPSLHDTQSIYSYMMNYFLQLPSIVWKL